ncbi:MAG TPA: CBS domain-containing protein [Candidatus Xenobia bacterium]|jgi:CBS domain-containing protein
MAIRPFSTTGIPTAADLMQTELLHVAPECSLYEAARMMATHHVSGLPVIDAQGRAVGVITLADLAAVWLKESRQEASDLNFYRNLFGHSPELASYFASFYADDAVVTVADAMTPKVLHTPENTVATDIVKLMQANHVHRLFVSRDGRLVGVVTTTDVMQALLRLVG